MRRLLMRGKNFLMSVLVLVVCVATLKATCFRACEDDPVLIGFNRCQLVVVVPVPVVPVVPASVGIDVPVVVFCRGDCSIELRVEGKCAFSWNPCEKCEPINGNILVYVWEGCGLVLDVSDGSLFCECKGPRTSVMPGRTCLQQICGIPGC